MNGLNGVCVALVWYQSGISRGSVWRRRLPPGKSKLGFTRPGRIADKLSTGRVVAGHIAQVFPAGGHQKSIVAKSAEGGKERLTLLLANLDSRSGESRWPST